jgi:mannosyltransferase OCH1-like enzyme
MNIDKNIFQTHKSIDYIKKKPKLVNAIRTWFKYKDDFSYKFYNNKMCDDFINTNFDENVIKAYSMLPMSVMKADLWRYCIIYKYGGIYSDVDTICNVNPNIFINDSLLTVSPEINTPYFCQWTFSAPKNSPILKTIIDLSVDRILNTQIKGEHIIHYLTGPEVFTDGIIKYLNNNNLPTFNNLTDYYNYPSNVLRVFNPTNFHNKFIKHLFAGDDKDGWKIERYSKLL